MNVTSIQSRIDASGVPLEKLAANPNVSQQDKVKEAARQFEAVLLRQIFSEARKSVLSNDSSDDPTVTGIYNDMINNQLADCVSKSGSFGLAKSLQTQLARQVLPK